MCEQIYLYIFGLLPSWPEIQQGGLPTLWWSTRTRSISHVCVVGLHGFDPCVGVCQTNRFGGRSSGRREHVGFGDDLDLRDSDGSTCSCCTCGGSWWPASLPSPTQDVTGIEPPLAPDSLLGLPWHHSWMGHTVPSSGRWLPCHGGGPRLSEGVPHSILCLLALPSWQQEPHV